MNQPSSTFIPVSADVLETLKEDIGFTITAIEDGYRRYQVTNASEKLNNALGFEWLSGSCSRENNSVKAVMFSKNPYTVNYQIDWLIHLPHLVKFNTPTPIPLKNQMSEDGSKVMLVFFLDSDRVNKLYLLHPNAVCGEV